MITRGLAPIAGASGNRAGHARPVDVLGYMSRRCTSNAKHSSTTSHGRERDRPVWFLISAESVSHAVAVRRGNRSLWRACTGPRLHAVARSGCAAGHRCCSGAWPPQWPRCVDARGKFNGAVDPKVHVGNFWYHRLLDFSWVAAYPHALPMQHIDLVLGFLDGLETTAPRVGVKGDDATSCAHRCRPSGSAGWAAARVGASVRRYTISNQGLVAKTTVADEPWRNVTRAPASKIGIGKEASGVLLQEICRGWGNRKHVWGFPGIRTYLRLSPSQSRKVVPPGALSTGTASRDRCCVTPHRICLRPSALLTRYRR
jgi:hypothetical protein